MGRESAFNAEQEAYLSGFTTIYAEKYDEMGVGASLTAWKPNTVREIYESEVFAVIKAAGDAEKEANIAVQQKTKSAIEASWILKIGKKFDNSIAKKRQAGTVTPTAATPPALSSDFLGGGRLTGLMLFENENKEQINAAASSRAAVDGVKPIARYQTCKMDAWKALTEEQRGDYQSRAQAVESDVGAYQKLFPLAMWQKATEICHGKRFGEMELLVLYGLREPGGALVIGDLNAHAPGRSADLKSEMPDWKTQVMVPWAAFVGRAIPERIHKVADSPVEVGRNEDGVPVFPDLKVSAMAPIAISSVMESYFSLLWAHAGGDISTMPWGEIGSDAGRYYDKTMFALPVTLRAPKIMEDHEVVWLAKYLVQERESSPPFTFLAVSPIHVGSTPDDLAGGGEGGKVGKKDSGSEGDGEGEKDVGDEGEGEKDVGDEGEGEKSGEQDGGGKGDENSVKTKAKSVGKGPKTAAKPKGRATGTKTKDAAAPRGEKRKDISVEETADETKMPVAKKLRKPEAPAAQRRSGRDRSVKEPPKAPPTLGPDGKRTIQSSGGAVRVNSIQTLWFKPSKSSGFNSPIVV
ncbi:hypothetical protein DFH09DRAFT_1327058 [Mycena vulgaris]|nr:hypothetical protein DFH09DRAFT_1327058 [Mycena vulgaris]